MNAQVSRPVGRKESSGASDIAVVAVDKTYSTRHRTVHALGNVSIEAHAGEFVSLLGPSGCGKSTLLMIVAGLMAPTRGTVTIGGTAVAGPQTQIGIAFQDPVLLDWRDAIGNVLLQVEGRGLSTSTYRARAAELLKQVGLGGFEHMRPYELSGGMKQRVAICRALIHDPPVLLMDEPFGALDALTRDQMAVDLQRMWLKSGKTVLFVTHSISEAVFLSDRVVVMSARPGTVDSTVEIDIPRPRLVRDRGSPAFSEYVDQITELFRAQGVIRDTDEAPAPLSD